MHSQAFASTHTHTQKNLHLLTRIHNVLRHTQKQLYKPSQTSTCTHTHTQVSACTHTLTHDQRTLELCVCRINSCQPRIFPKPIKQVHIWCWYRECKQNNARNITNKQYMQRIKCRTQWHAQRICILTHLPSENSKKNLVVRQKPTQNRCVVLFFLIRNPAAIHKLSIIYAPHAFRTLIPLFANLLWRYLGVDFVFFCVHLTNYQSRKIVK